MEAKLSTTTIRRKAVQTLVPLLGLVLVASTPAAAGHGSLSCEPPEGLSPLFDLLHEITELLFLTGVTLGTAGFILGGIYMMLPGDDASQKGKTIWKYTLLGTVLVLSSEMIMTTLVKTLSPGIC